MKKIILLLAFMCSVAAVSAQIKVGGTESESHSTYEYATVSVRVTFDSNSIIYDETSFQKSPMIYMPNGDHFILKNSLVKTSENRFKHVNEIINYMAKEGWRLVSATVIQNNFDTSNSVQNTIINKEFDHNFLQQLIFERKIN